jgi:protoporphyrinogen oxidase
MPGETAVIIGAGPAGLTAAYELLTRSAIKPVVLEQSASLGGLARTVVYKGNRIDIGPHRFFSKSDRVMEWWLNMLPLQATDGTDQQITYQHQARPLHTSPDGPDPTSAERVMLVLKRQTRIYYNRQFFDYPISLHLPTLRKLGLIRTVKIGGSYLKALLLPIRPEANLEHFMINRFGQELYRTFFKAYTEKVWGIACDQISAD